MSTVFIVLSIILLFLGHYFKTLRWKQFIEIYEEPKKNVLLRSLSLGYIINFYVPFRVGDFFRAWYSGKKMKNGFLFSLATIIIDRYLDVLIVGLIFTVFTFTNINILGLNESALFYIIISIFLLILAIFAIKKSYIFKVIMKKIASIFNSKIEMQILKLSWCFISSFKDIYKKLSRKKLILNTLLMWMFYLFSYYTFSLFISSYGNNLSFFDVFSILFSKNNLDLPAYLININANLPLTFPFIMAIYIISPLIILILLSLIPQKLSNTKNKNKNVRYLNILPHENFSDRLAFLEAYFSTNSGDYFKKYLEINRDVSVLQDFSAGSSATTILCADEKNTFYRKYAFGESGEKLYDQIKWLHKHKKNIKVTKILRDKHDADYCYYDMPYDKRAMNFFNFIHSTQIETSWALLNNVLNDLKNNLYTQNVRSANSELIKKYIDSKVLKNLEKIKNSKEIKKLLKYEKLVINGVSYNNLEYYDEMLSYENLYKIFKDDNYSEIHGDLTIENIISLQNSEKDYDYYIIDPNTGNVHDSCNLDYAKLLQSLHGGYEFLMQAKTVDVEENNIYYLHTKSNSYDKLYKKYAEFLKHSFSKSQVKSIYFHELIHWLRLMPYKISKDEKKSVLFFAAFIIVLNEVGDMYEK